MAITPIGSANFFSTDTNGFTSGTVDTSTANFIAVWFAGGSAARTLSDSKSNTWLAGTEVQGFFGTRAGRWYYAYNAIVGTGHTFTITGTGSAPTLQVLWYSGVKSSADPFDSEAAGGTSNSATTIQAGSVTPTEANCLVLSGLFIDGFKTPTIDGGFTKEQSTTDTNFGHFYGAAGDLVQTTATAANPTWTVASADIVIAQTLILKAAAAAGRTSKNTRTNPLGMDMGMNWQGDVA